MRTAAQDAEALKNFATYDRNVFIDKSSAQYNYAPDGFPLFCCARTNHAGLEEHHWVRPHRELTVHAKSSAAL
jgi:protein-L-isoaspartate O-methyltransferase